MDHELLLSEGKGTMIFKTDTPIYRQIVELCFAKIQSGEWKDKVPSVRDFALELTVNPHTVLKAYDYLQREGIITPKRGMGMFLTEDAYKFVINYMKEEFLHNDVEKVFYKMDLLGIGINEVIELYKKREENKNEEKK